MRSAVIKSFDDVLYPIINKYDYYIEGSVHAYLKYLNFPIIEIPGKKLVGTTNNSKCVIIYDLKRYISTRISHQKPIIKIGFFISLNNEIQIVTLAEDNQVKIWNLESSLLLSIKNAIGFTLCRNKMIVINHKPYYLALWNIETLQQEKKCECYPYTGTIVPINEDIFLFIISDLVTVWNMNELNIIHRIPINSCFLYKRFHLHSDERLIYIHSNRHHLAILNVTTGEIERQLENEIDNPSFEYVTSSGDKIIACSSKVLRIWDYTSGKVLENRNVTNNHQTFR